MIEFQPYTLKLAQISSLFYQQNIPLIPTLYSFDGWDQTPQGIEYWSAIQRGENQLSDPDYQQIKDWVINYLIKKREHLMKEPKLCKDCKYCDLNEFNASLSLCTHPNFKKYYNPVTGKPNAYCGIMRESDFSCGTNARYYEKRLS